MPLGSNPRASSIHASYDRNGSRDRWCSAGAAEETRARAKNGERASRICELSRLCAPLFNELLLFERCCRPADASIRRRFPPLLPRSSEPFALNTPTSPPTARSGPASPKTPEPTIPALPTSSGVHRENAPPWHDMETPVAQVVGPVEAAIIDHHGKSRFAGRLLCRVARASNRGHNSIAVSALTWQTGG